ncbi:uncharacterized protein LOC115956420 [Quercus lobata]|uniref:uncharacterized protein LOC115956420 n=1 Tax=Quercus lobata TaxID=97700 RepID=UPI001243D2CD|nr:uncharacterized protein LOC115956420 [Quercus lobata]
MVVETNVVIDINVDTSMPNKHPSKYSRIQSEEINCDPGSQLLTQLQHIYTDCISASKGKKKWSPSPLDSFKTKFDGAVFENSNEAGIGGVIRKSNGEINAALSEKIPLPPSVVILESLAARRAVLFALEVGITQSSFEGDSEIIMTSLKLGDNLSSSFGNLISDTLILASSLLNFSFSHTVRLGNVVAHALARRAFLYFSLTVWMESVPLDIFLLIAADLQAP